MILGVDPGASGALALLSATGDLLQVEDMPTVKVRGRPRLACGLLADLLRQWVPRHAIIEQVDGMPGQGGSASFKFGYAAGGLEAALATLGVPVEFVAPVTWKRAMKVTRDKGLSRLMAQRLWPAHTAAFARVRDDGRAEAALIAHYGVSRMRLGL